jgi:hypothetical protein
MNQKFPIILSFDVGVIHLSYCLLTKKELINNDGSKKIDWEILDWNNIDLTNRDEMKCHCGAKASLSNIVNNEIKYYCKTHSKKLDNNILPFDDFFTADNNHTCCYKPKDCECGKKSKLYYDDKFYCNVHAKQIYKQKFNDNKLREFKLKNSKLLNFDDVKYNLLLELEKRSNLLNADYVVIENQPSFKNPRMKSIACTIYDYYLIRGIIDKNITKSNIKQIKFMSPSNKLKVATEGDTKLLIKAKSTGETDKYKLTKSLGIKYCLELINHLPDWIKYFNSFKKKDDLADSFLQGAYYYTNNIKII